MNLAKDVIDFGLYTNDRERLPAFWQTEIGLPFEETLPAGGGVHQLRHGAGAGSIVKINHARDPLPSSGRSGYRELWIPRDSVREPQPYVDPEGNRVSLVPFGFEGTEGISIVLGVRDEDAHHRFFGEALGLPSAGDRAYRIGKSLVRFAHDPSVPADAATTCNRKMRATGYRYFTIQVWNVDADHGEIVERGGTEGYPPRTLGKVARISFVRDPDGNWIELSQRASLTGDLSTPA